MAQRAWRHPGDTAPRRFRLPRLRPAAWRNSTLVANCVRRRAQIRQPRQRRQLPFFATRLQFFALRTGTDSQAIGYGLIGARRVDIGAAIVTESENAWTAAFSNLGIGLRCAAHELMFAISGLEGLWRWCRWGDSNTRPTDYESVALPTELHRH